MKLYKKCFKIRRISVIDKVKHMKKILFSLAILLTSVFVLTGCAKCISTETWTVRVKITDEYYSPMYQMPVFNGKTTMMITYPAVYRITVEYNDVEYDIFGHNTYDKYSERIGEYVDGILETKKYDDGTVRYDIVSLE